MGVSLNFFAGRGPLGRATGTQKSTRRSTPTRPPPSNPFRSSAEGPEVLLEPEIDGVPGGVSSHCETESAGLGSPRSRGEWLHLEIARSVGRPPHFRRQGAVPVPAFGLTTWSLGGGGASCTFFRYPGTTPPGVVTRKKVKRNPHPGSAALPQPQTQAEGPESAQISPAIRSCSAFGAFCGSPTPPYPSQVDGRIW